MTFLVGYSILFLKFHDFGNICKIHIFINICRIYDFISLKDAYCNQQSNAYLSFSIWLLVLEIWQYYSFIHISVYVELYLFNTSTAHIFLSTCPISTKLSQILPMICPYLTHIMFLRICVLVCHYGMYIWLGVTN